MSFEPDTRMLPPFGIKDLHGPSKSPGIIHITAPQYDSTIKSWPDAVLTYLDDDDGETITVGSGLELRQRLDEPFRHGRFTQSGTSSSSRRGSFDDRMVHLFDIRPDPNAGLIWRDHEAYSSKTVRALSAPSSPRKVEASKAGDHEHTAPMGTDVTRADTLTYPVLPVQQSDSVPWTDKPQRMEEYEAQTSSTEASGESESQEASSTSTRTSSASDGLGDFVEKNIDSFANFLDSAAEVLRKVAQKTRDADASPVESMLSGLKDVFSEIGQLGFEVLNGLDYEPIPTKQPEQPAPQTKTEAGTVEVEQDNLKSSPKPVPTIRKRVSFADMKEERSVETIKGQSEIPPQSAVLADGSNMDADSASTPAHVSQGSDEYKGSSFASQRLEAELSRLDSAMAQRKAIRLTDLPLPPPKPSCIPYRSFPNRPGPTAMHARQPPAPPASILDLESSNAEFTARYPPLMSLRRAKTISDLQKNQQGGPEAMTTKAALTRYPSIGQLESSRNRNDTHHNLRGKTLVDTSPKKLFGSEPLRPNSPVSPINDLDRVSIKAPRRGYKSPSVEDEPMEEKDVILVKPYLSDTASVTKAVPRVLPGSWPEPEDMSTLPISNESSGAFFNRMTGLKEPEFQPVRSVSPALSCRNTSPPADPFWPSTNSLRRANTVGTASNPAARLTRPFDPMINAPKPLFPRPTGPAPQPPSGADHGLPRRTVSQRQPPRSVPQATTSTIGGTNPWNFTRPTQAPMMQPPRVPGPPPQQMGWPYHPYPFDNLARQYPPPPPQNNSTMPALPFLPPLPPLSLPPKVRDCVKALRQMGYGLSDPNEMARLNVYAGAADGDVFEAVEMIEEDRAGVEKMDQGKEERESRSIRIS